MNNISERFIEKIYNMANKEEVEEEAYERAKMCFLDYLGVTIAGANVTNNILHEFIEENSGKFGIIGTSKRVGMHCAIMVNAYNSHVLELDDGHRVAMMHLGAPIFSAIYTLGEKNKCTERELLKAAIVGYEAAIRLAELIQPSHKKKGFHATGTCGTVGCAMAVATLLKYNRKEFENVLSAAATSGAGLLEVITGKSQQKPYNIANASIAGVNAALFGKCFSGPSDVLGGPRGFISNMSEGVALERFLQKEEKKAIYGIYTKPYAACRHCHAPIEAAMTLSRENHIIWKNIERIEVYTYDLAVYGHDHFEIEGVNSAKMSIPYSVASAIINLDASLKMFTNEKIKDKNVLELARRVKVISSTELSKLVPDKRAAEVKLVMKDGKIYCCRVDYPKGEPENRINQGELFKKFESLLESAGKKDDEIKNLWTSVLAGDFRYF